MTRKPFNKPIPKTNIALDQEGFEFVEAHRRPCEPKYLTMKRIIGEYSQLKDKIGYLEEEIELKDIIINDLKNTLTESRNKTRKLETQQIISV
jgi:hypothetical protein